ncbi:hypothetical protein N7509_007928 [Penicillium cosmopolitanum]|uniref:Uncharacterized protein n=1 Tax=Penicillium cosmopolitanum TaxID=1131564 RepID=A0A9X0B8X7_9EURO|nr:uncharacterized protein N7509_007928 [Penicillium cosmopolitanum]KAJ5392438.1 hypothetical protein N7509_007928 [Penicillium cosmopolitanum]
MKVAFLQVILAALAITPSLGSMLEGHDDLAEAIKGLTRDPDARGWIQLSDTGSRLQSVDSKGKVLDEIQLTAEQEADLRSKHAAKVEKVNANKIADPSATSTPKPSSDLEKKSPGCADWSSICDVTPDCYFYNCDDCFKINPIGVCYSYS